MLHTEKRNGHAEAENGGMRSDTIGPRISHHWEMVWHRDVASPALLRRSLIRTAAATTTLHSNKRTCYTLTCTAAVALLKVCVSEWLSMRAPGWCCDKTRALTTNTTTTRTQSNQAERAKPRRLCAICALIESSRTPSERRNVERGGQTSPNNETIRAQRDPQSHVGETFDCTFVHADALLLFGILDSNVFNSRRNVSRFTALYINYGMLEKCIHVNTFCILMCMVLETSRRNALFMSQHIHMRLRKRT